MLLIIAQPRGVSDAVTGGRTCFPSNFSVIPNVRVLRNNVPTPVRKSKDFVQKIHASQGCLSCCSILMGPLKLSLNVIKCVTAGRIDRSEG